MEVSEATGAWSWFIWQHESQSVGWWWLVAVPAVREEWEGGLGGQWTHESEAVKEVRVSGAKHLRVGLETVYKLCLQCHESPGHYNDQPSWGHIQHPPLPLACWDLGFTLPGAATHFTDVEFLSLYSHLCCVPTSDQARPQTKRSGPALWYWFDSRAVKSWALSLSSLDGAVIIVTQMSSSVMSDVVMDVWPGFWRIRALSPQWSHYPGPGADKKCQWAPCLCSNVRLSLGVDVIILCSQPVSGPQLWLSSHPPLSVAWLPPSQSGNQGLQIGEISINHRNVISWNVCFRSKPQIAISLSITYLECQQCVYHRETDHTRCQSGWMDR